MTILTSARGRLIDGLALVLISTVLPFGICHLLVKFLWLPVFIEHRAAFLIKHRQDDRVTTAAERRFLDLLGIARRHAHRLLHRQRRDLIVRAIDELM